VFEAFQKITDEPLTQCRSCKGKVEKLISHSSFQLKGSGWYLTDYARKSSSPSEPSKTSDKTEKAGEAKSSDTKTSTATKSDKSSD
jgi:putative FmdB family regulatory protein